MTTIAWDGETLAADTKCTDGESFFGFESKIFESEDGSRAAAATGNSDECTAFIDWFLAGADVEKRPLGENQEFGDDFRGVGVEVSDGAACCYEYGKLLIADEVIYRMAWGSGWQWALAAMDLDHNAVDAVTYAATRDLGTGGSVEQYTPDI